MGFCCANHQFFRGVQRFGLHLRVVMATDAHQAQSMAPATASQPVISRKIVSIGLISASFAPYGLKHTLSSGQSSLCSVAVY